MRVPVLEMVCPTRVNHYNSPQIEDTRRRTEGEKGQ